MFKMSQSSHKNLQLYGCVFISVIEGMNRKLDMSVSPDDAFLSAVDEDVVSSDCFIYSFEKLIKLIFGVDVTITDRILLEDVNDDNVTLVFTKGHCELLLSKDNSSVFDPGYQNDIVIDSEGFLVTNKGVRSKYKGQNRSVSKYKEISING